LFLFKNKTTKNMVVPPKEKNYFRKNSSPPTNTRSQWLRPMKYGMARMASGVWVVKKLARWPAANEPTSYSQRSARAALHVIA
jgi:hypothetical protein